MANTRFHEQILFRSLDLSSYQTNFDPKMRKNDPTKTKPQMWSVQDDGYAKKENASGKGLNSGIQIWTEFPVVARINKQNVTLFYESHYSNPCTGYKVTP